MTDIPKGAKVPTDHLKSAAQIEAEGVETVQVEFKGETYTFPAGIEDASGDVLDAIDDQKLSHALHGLLEEKDDAGNWISGPSEWKRFKKTHPRVHDYTDMFDAYAKVIGLGTTGE